MNLRLKLFAGWYLGLPARRAYSPEGAKNYVAVVLLKI